MALPTFPVPTAPRGEYRDPDQPGQPDQPGAPEPPADNRDQKQCEDLYRIWRTFSGDNHGVDPQRARETAQQAELALRQLDCLPGCVPCPVLVPPGCPEPEEGDGDCTAVLCPPCPDPGSQEVPIACPPIKTTGKVSYWWILAVASATWYLAAGQPKDKRKR